jgi:hypothetical protein
MWFVIRVKFPVVGHESCAAEKASVLVNVTSTDVGEQSTTEIDATVSSKTVSVFIARVMFKHGAESVAFA